MTPRGSRPVPENCAAAAVCSRCAAKITPYFSDNAVASYDQINQLIGENFLTVKGAALFLPRGNGSSPSSVPRITQRRNKHTGDLQQHLQTMFTLLRPEDTIRLAVRLESAYPQCTRYMVVVSTNGRQDTEESVVLGMDFTNSDCSQCTVGLVLPLWSDTLIHLDGDGGFSVSTANRVHIFKPVSVQAMWSALQSLHKACEVARCHNYYPGSLFLTWVSYYQTHISSEQHCINEWNAMQDVQSHRSDSPVLFTDLPTERERTERLIKTRLREIMMQKDLENVTSKEIRSELEMQMVCNLREFKEFIDNEMIVILGQMDSPTEIFDHVYLGSEWNASNLDELQNSGVRYILNVTREIDNFFPGLFEYHNIRVYDEEATNLLEYWNDTYKFISKAKKAGVKCLVHCKMGVSRSASTVIAYAMKEYGWDLDRAYEHVKERRAVTKPNPSFMKQLEEYQGILLASKQRHNKLWRSHSDSDLSEQQEPVCKSPHSDPHNQQHKPNGTRSVNNVLQTINSSQPGTENTHSDPSTHPTSQKNPERPCEEPLLATLPRARAATVVPEQNLADSCCLKVEVTEPITHPQPLPSLHVLPRSLSTSLHGHKSPAVPEPKIDSDKLSLDVPDQNDSFKNSHSSGTLSLALCLDTVSSVTETGGDLASSRTPLAISPCEVPLESRCSTSNSSESCSSGETDQRTGSSTSLGTDSIDFFSAREKFLGLSRDGQTSSLYEAMTPRMAQSQNPSLCLEESSTAAAKEGSSHSESSCEAEAPPPAEPDLVLSDNSVSVRHIVSELESVSSQQPPSHSPEQPAVQEEQVEKEEVEQEPERTSLPPSTSSPPCEQPEQESLLSHSSPHSACTDDADSQQLSNPPGGADSIKAEAEEHGEEARPLDDDDSGIIPDPSLCTATVCPSLDPSSSSSSLLWLESDAEDVTTRPHDLHKIQETLRELQAFLYEAGGMEACFNYSQQLKNTHGSTESQPRTPAVWQKAMEMEARIRQAGLTPPSLMKRSASLAKLDQLELSTHDLNDWDFRSEVPSSPSSSSSSHSHLLSSSHDEVHKKQRVLPQTLSEANRTETSCHTPFSCPQHKQGGSMGQLTHTSAPPAVSVCTQQQQHTKPHPIRRPRKTADKKKTVTVLYNTM
ncbi:protein phosphatase Slingshot homolog 2 isoform X1 [Pangasianodon hypophthalmus]|uniref:protein phosphatase Slingshot homolog 2 isoform X1 n=1 Tax=Pangasianodon hypophthalmus TaxID=310915 RepID=UPI000EFE3F32|nr:protein phosphatase Slingshot homolog 2 isoform X1 [Pangasianodon hypophthalmus]